MLAVVYFLCVNNTEHRSATQGSGSPSARRARWGWPPGTVPCTDTRQMSCVCFIPMSEERENMESNAVSINYEGIIILPRHYDYKGVQ